MKAARFVDQPVPGSSALASQTLNTLGGDQPTRGCGQCVCELFTL
jgi:hypothetical protein